MFEVGGDARMNGVPSAEVGANVSGGVIDAEAKKIGVGATADEAAARDSRPSASRDTTAASLPNALGGAAEAGRDRKSDRRAQDCRDTATRCRCKPH